MLAHTNATQEQRYWVHTEKFNGYNGNFLSFINELAKEIAHLALEGTDADLSFFHAGHLCILPTIPMASRSVVPYGPGVKAMMEWSRIEKVDKPQEAIECERLFANILLALEKYF